MKSIIMIGGGIQETPAISRLKGLGYRTIVTDQNPNAPAFDAADVAVNIDARDVQSLIAWTLAHKQSYNIAGIFTLTNQAPTVALVANATGLPSLPVATVMQCDNKLLMKRKFQDLGLPSARYTEVSAPQEAEEAISKRGKCVFYLKAVDGFGGKGIKRITSPKEVDEAFLAIKSFTKFPIIILEEEMNGHFIDVQGVFYKDVFYRAGIADSYFSSHLEGFSAYNPIEIFNVSPSQQPKEIVDQTYVLLEDASRALGMNWGPVGGDFILMDEGLKIIEIGPRLHGPNGTLQIFPAATGIQPFEFMVQTIAGDEPNPDYLKEQHHRVALCYVFVSPRTDLQNSCFSIPN